MIPGRVVKLVYDRTGRNPGRYAHDFGPGVRMDTNPDGSVTLRGPRRVWADDRMKGFEKYVENPPKKWLVLYVKGGRIGSFPLSQKKKVLQALGTVLLIQRDANGTEHYEVLSPPRKQTLNRKNPRRRSSGSSLALPLLLLGGLWLWSRRTEAASLPDLGPWGMW